MSWKNLFQKQIYPEFKATKISNVIGKIPTNIKGTLYRQTAVPLERNGQRLNHWFDCDGAILRVKLENGQAEVNYQYVKTEPYLAEEKAGKYIYPNMGNLADIQHREKMGLNNANRANTSVIKVEGDKLLALWEGSIPHELCANTLDTKGVTLLGGLKPSETFSAHPKVDPETKHIYNIGFDRPTPMTMNVYRSDPTGKIIKRNSIKHDKHPHMIHDVAICGKYLIYVRLPIKFEGDQFSQKKKTFEEASIFDPSMGTEITIIDKESLEVVKRIPFESFFFFHYANGFVDKKGNIVFDLVYHEDFDVFKIYTKDIMKADLSKSNMRSRLVRMTVDLNSSKVEKETIFERICELPTVESSTVGKEYDNCYLITTYTAKDWLRGIAKVNVRNGKTIERFIGKDHYPNEILPISVAGTKKKDEEYSILPVYDGRRDKTEIRILDSHLDDVAIFDLR